MNMKKLFRKINKQGVSASKLYKSKIYYVVLILCVLGVTTAAVTVTVNSLRKANIDRNMSRLASEKEIKHNIVADNGKLSPVTDVPSISTSKSNQTANSTDKSGTAQNLQKTSAAEYSQNKVNTAAEKKAANTVTTNKSSTAGVTSKSAQFAKPVLGEIIKEFAMDKLLFSDTLQEWTVHSGIDIACTKGTQVKAADSGTVSEIKNDPRYGITVIIDHPDGLKTVYCNLAGSDMVECNQKVKKGDVIGGVGDTALFECKTEPHLHFEVWKDYQPVDPKKYLP